MSFKHLERNIDYWESLQEPTSKYIARLNKKLMKGIKQKLGQSLLVYKMDLSYSFKSPCICRSGNGCTILMPIEFLAWLDSAIFEMMEKEGIRKSFCFDNTEIDFSPFLMEHWIEWIVAHELGHFFCGHLTGQTKKWEEWNYKEHKSLMSDELILAQEFDADFFAAGIFFHDLSTVIKDPRVRRWGVKYFEDLGFIFFVLFFMLDTKVSKKGTHPKPVERMAYFILKGFYILEKETNENVINKYKSFINGASSAAKTVGDDGENFIKTLKNIEPTNMIKAAKVLIKNGINRKRIMGIGNDWLKTPQAGLYNPKQ